MIDYIDRKAAIDAIKKLRLPRTNGERPSEGISRVVWECAVDCAEERIRRLPSIDPVKHGRWIGHHLSSMVTCSVCGVVGWNRYYNYCPNCGAFMDTEEGEAHEID